jgi:hypothetical protein
MKKAFAVTLALALPFTIAACNDDGGPTGVDGATTFTATVSGDVSTSFEGQAHFGQATDPQTGETGWVVWMSTTEDPNTGQNIYLVRQGTRPGTGTHAFVDLDHIEQTDGIGALYLDFSGGQLATVMASTGGTLTLTESSDNRVRGSFSIQAEGIALDQGEPFEGSVTIAGEFSATTGSVFFPGF